MTNTHNELLGLAERVEGATGPDREIDARIWCALNGKRYVSHFDRHDGTLGAEFREPPKRTSIVTKKALPLVTVSIDAAMTLAEGFVLLSLSDIAADGLPLAVLGDPSTTPPGEWTGFCFASSIPTTQKLALALTAACLRAHASLREGTGR